MRALLLGALVALVLSTAGATNRDSIVATKASVVGPELSDNKYITVCIKGESAAKCTTAASPQSLGPVKQIIRTSPVKNSTTSWIAITDKAVAICGMNVESDNIACQSINGLYEALQAAFLSRRVRVSDIVNQSTHELRSAAQQVSTQLAAKAVAVPGGHKFVTSEYDDSVDPRGNDGNGGADIPVIPIYGEGDGSGNADDGGYDTNISIGSNGNASGSGPSVEPPGSAPGESAARARCTSSAYLAWRLEDAVCRAQKTPAEQSACNEYNWREYQYSLELCRQIP
ncbi:hypothetical protein H3H36_07090 [Duganella sp. FT3S]|uniref:Uncharacterized protein n=1 Tax=Rugamonas fusca TaxID=2758568 RepID=A0A7W2EFZ4_9BURK|nr:hypothetical protein [Rugamonas fusca]MBA5605126.1 hypothetical protein [Rugamonas fusca]